MDFADFIVVVLPCDSVEILRLLARHALTELIFDQYVELLVISCVVESVLNMKK